jgi:flagellar hook-length control protein FliK
LLLPRRNDETAERDNVPQLPTNNTLGLGGQASAPERGLASAHADRARSPDPAEKRQVSGGDDRGVGFGRALKDQLRERREPAAGAAASRGEELPDGGKPSPAATTAGEDASAREAVAMAGLMPLPVQPHAALDVAGIAKALSGGEDRIGGGAERGAQRGLIAMLQRHAGAGATDAMPASLRALANALATTSGTTNLASFAAPAESLSVGDNIASTQTPGAQATTTPAATPTSPPLVATPGDPARMPVLDVDTPMGHQAWRDAVGHHVTWMADQGISRAELRLNPAHLGPIEVRVSVQNDQVNVSFHASHAATREALESSLPRLRELLGDSGLSLGQASVSQQFAGGERAPEHAASSDRGGEFRVDREAAQIETPITTRVRVGLLDAYA